MAGVEKNRLIPQKISHKGKFNLTAGITPAFGANLVSFTVDGTELIFWDEAACLKGENMTGAFNMFPTPCRLHNCSYEFEGRRIVQKKNGEDIFIHGLVRDESFQFRNEGHSLVSSVDIRPGHPIYSGFPFSCEFQVTHTLHDADLTVSFALKNKDTRNIPFGYGIHPFWRIHGARKDVSVRVPCDHILELKDLVPTGNTAPVAGTDLDLRHLRNIERLFIDNAFWERKPGETAELALAAIGKRVIMEASDNFPHMIVYAPEGKPFVCVENLTTCPNAPNLVTAGKGDIAHMLVAPAGKTVEGWIRYTIQTI